MNEGRDTSANKTHLFNWLHDMTVQMGRGRRERVDWVEGGQALPPLRMGCSRCFQSFIRPCLHCVCMCVGARVSVCLWD